MPAGFCCWDDGSNEKEVEFAATLRMIISANPLVCNRSQIGVRGLAWLIGLVRDEHKAEAVGGASYLGDSAGKLEHCGVTIATPSLCRDANKLQTPLRAQTQPADGHGGPLSTGESHCG